MKADEQRFLEKKQMERRLRRAHIYDFVIIYTFLGMAFMIIGYVLGSIIQIFNGEM